MLCLKDKNLRINMGKAGKEKAKQFSNKDIAEKYYKLYEKVIKNEC